MSPEAGKGDGGVTKVTVPRYNVNDDRVVVAEIHASEGDAVKEGQVILAVTTSKATYEIEAEAGGYFWPVAGRGDEVPVLGTVAYITPDPERPEPEDEPDDEPDVAAGAGSGRDEAGSVRATEDARALAERHGVDLAALGKRGIVRARDVEEALRARGEGGGDAGEPRDDAPVRGRLDPEFLSLIRDPDSGFRHLSSDLKVALYRQHGAEIGEGVGFAAGAAIFAEAVEVGDGCTFGENTLIRAETLRVGKGCLFGRDNDIMCRRIEFGDMLFLVNRVLIGQGGAMGPEAELWVGHSCLISSDVLINTAHRVRIGDVSCLSPRVSIYTHSHWQNVLEGYQATFAPVEIGDHVWITGNCLVTPGAVMEDGSQALANSTVVGRVPARTVVSGVPAKPLKEVRSDLSPAERDRIARAIWPDVEDAVRRAGEDPERVHYGGLGPDPDADADVQAAFGPRPGGWEGAYFDLESYRFSGPETRTSDEVRNVFRKHGIRFEPIHWRYRADLGRFNA